MKPDCESTLKRSYRIGWQRFLTEQLQSEGRKILSVNISC